MLFELDFFHCALSCCVKYSNIKYHDKSFNTYHQKKCSKKMSKFGFKCQFYVLNYFELGYFFHNP